MDSNQLIFPMFAMVLLTFSVLARLFFARRKSVAEGKVNPEYFKVYQGGAEPEASAQLARHFANLFEAPVLFYAACIAGIALHMAGALFLVLAWAYVLLRLSIPRSTPARTSSTRESLRTSRAGSCCW